MSEERWIAQGRGSTVSVLGMSDWRLVTLSIISMTGFHGQIFLSGD